VIFRPVSQKRYEDYLGYGIWFYQSLPKSFPACQLVWPDADGRFPWERDHDREFFSRQQELWKDA